MAIDALSSKKAGALALIATAAVSLTSIPAVAQPEGRAARQATPVRAEVQITPDAPDLPQGLSARAWTVADADSGDVLAAKDAHRKLAPASTLKTLFALTVLPKFAAGSVRQVGAGDLEGIGAGSSLVGIRKGKRYKVADLWQGVFLRSGNDAVHVLAAMNGGWDATAREMQRTARKLGARDTTVKSPDGYDAPGQVSSAHDLTIFARAGLANEDFARYCSTARAQFPGPNGTTEIENTNRLLVGSHGLTRYPGIIGVKNGYTTNAGNTLIAAARRGGRTLVVTVLNPQSKATNAVYTEARSLLDWGFSSAKKARPVDSLHIVHAQHASYAHGAGPGQVNAGATDIGSRGTWYSALAPWAYGAGSAALAAGAVFLLRLRGRGRTTPPGGTS